MKNLMTGLMVAALAAAAGVPVQAASGSSTSSDPSQKSQSGSSYGTQSGSSSDSQYGSTQSGSRNTTASSQTGTMTGQNDARSVIKDWPQVSQQAAQNMLDRYGQPDVVSNIMLVWKDKTPFTRITVTRDAVPHNFPTQHQDVLTEEIKLAVPIDKVTELARFDGSLLVDRTKGTVAARSDRESSNFLALNLADDIINGKRDADSARKFYTDTLNKQMSGKSSAYTEKLNFTVTGTTGYQDTSSGQSGASGSSGEQSGSSGSSSDQLSPSDQNSNGSDISNPSNSPSSNSPSSGGTQHQGD